MGLFQQISDIISANLSEMVNAYDDPEQMLKQAVREMDDSIVCATQETARALANEKKLTKELAHNESESKQWHSRAEQAVSAGDDELARKALSRKLEHDKLVVALNDQLNAAREATRTLRHQLEGMKVKLAEAKRNLATLSARNRAAEIRKKVYTRRADSDLSIDAKAFDKFERLRERVEMAEAEADALAELNGCELTASSAELDAAPDSSNSIEAALDAIKKQRNA
jgi:phage shock protein A